MVIAERTTSYGFATLSSVKPIAIAQQGEQIYGRKFCFITNKKNNPKLCIQKCNTDPRVGTSNDPMGKANVDMDKVLVPKGLICLQTRIPQILRKSMRLSPVPYRLNTVMLLF
jgi:hypothetical protein